MQNSEDRGIGSVLLGAIITICLLFAVGFTIRHTIYSPSRPPIATNVREPMGEPLARIYFEISSADLPAEAGGAIQTVKEKAEANPGLTVLISGYHDPSGDPEQNKALAIERAEAAREALVAAGIPASRIRVLNPEVIAGDADLQEARRVDIRLQ